MTHEHAADLTKAGEELQVEDAKKFLDSNFNSDIITFAYPYTEVSPGLLYWVRRYDFAARGGRGDGSQVYIKSDMPAGLVRSAQPAQLHEIRHRHLPGLDRQRSFAARPGPFFRSMASAMLRPDSSPSQATRSSNFWTT